MAKGKSLIQNLADNNISFDFIMNETKDSKEFIEGKDYKSFKIF